MTPLSLEDVGRELDELLARRPTTLLELPTFDAWCLIGVLQLALRHPGIQGEPRAAAERLKDGFVRVLATTPALATLAALGDDPNYDGGPHESTH